MGLFDFLRRRDERAIPRPGTAEFDAAVRGSAPPDEQGADRRVSFLAGVGPAGKALSRLGVDPTDARAGGVGPMIDLRGTGARENVIAALREHGIDPERPLRRIDITKLGGLNEAILRALGEAGVHGARADQVEAGIELPQQDWLTRLEHLAAQRASGQLTEAEFEEEKKRLLGR